MTVWTGTHLFLWGGEDGHGRSARGRGRLFDPAGRRWRAAAAGRRPPGLPLAFAECYPRGAAAGWFVFAQLCAQHAVWDQRTGRWARAGRDLDPGASVVAAGPVFLFAGAGRLLAYDLG